jgi:hypothetical protein
MTRLNFTGRQRIPRKDVNASIDVEDGKLKLTATLNRAGSGGHDFPDDAQIILEVVDRQTFMLFNLGNVADQVGIRDEHLFEFHPAGVAALQLELRVVSSDGLVLGSALGVKPELPDEDKRDRISLLPFYASDDLGQRLWQLDLSADPCVLINRGVGDWNAFARQEMFVCLVYPELIRAIAKWELNQKREQDEDAQWTKFLRGLGYDPADAPDEEDEFLREEWLDSVTGSFAIRHELLKKLKLEEDG